MKFVTEDLSGYVVQGNLRGKRWLDLSGITSIEEAQDKLTELRFADPDTEFRIVEAWIKSGVVYREMQK